MIAGGLQREGLSRRVMIAAGIVVVAIITAVGAKLCLEFGLAWRCPMISLLGIPCPSCGTTRAFAALAELNFFTALKFNPLFVLGTVALPILLFAKRVPDLIERNGWFVFGAIVAVNWIYLILFLPR